MICFISWGTTVIGGVQNLILNISEELNTKNQKAKIFGFKYCLIYKELIKRDIEFDFIDLTQVNPNQLHSYLTEKDVIVFGSYSPRYRLFMFKESNPRILYWNVIANKLSLSNRYKFIDFKFRTRKLVNQLIKSKSVVFMDLYGLKSIKSEVGIDLFQNDTNLYLPIPVKSFNKKNIFLTRNLNFNEVINITYVGRSSIWKMQPLKKIITDLLDIKNSNININIITQDVNEYKRFLSNIKIPENLSVIYHNNLIGSSYREFLIKNSDLHFAMGTSALDGGILGIPTICVDYSNHAFRQDYKYLWLYDIQGFDLGHPIESKNSKKSNSMSEIIDLYKDSNSLELKKISELTFNYVNNNHEISQIVDKLLIYTRDSQSRVNTILNYTISNFKIVSLISRIFGRDLMEVKK